MRLGQKRIFAEHLDGIEKSDFFDFKKSWKRVYQKAKIESHEQSKKGSHPKQVCGKGQDARQSQKLLRSR